MLNNWIPNIQASWVKEGPKLAQMALDAGCNDFMGTLINESIRHRPAPSTASAWRRARCAR